MDSITLTCGGYAIAVYHQSGSSGEKIVFLHGGGLDSAMLSWKEVIAQLGGAYDVYAIDLLGYGASDKPDVAYSIPFYTELMRDVLRQLNIEKAHFVGLSMGGGIGIDFSLKYPSLVETLVLVDALGLYNRMPFHRLCWWLVNSPLNTKSYTWMAKSRGRVKWVLTASLFGDKRKATDELLEELFELVRQPDCNKAWERFQRYELGKTKLTTDLFSHLSELTMPVLLVNGDKDAGVPLKSAVAAQSIIPNSRLYVMKGCRHWPQKERPEEFTQAVKAFWAGTRSTGCRVAEDAAAGGK